MPSRINDRTLQAVGAGTELRLVMRGELMDRLDANRRQRATIVHAPAGYGKTCLLRQWCDRLKEAGVEVIWLAAEPSMRDPAIFHGALAAVIGRHGLTAARSPSKRLLRTNPIETFAKSLLARLESKDDLVLIVDDYETMASAEVNEVVANLIRHSAGHAHFVIASRVEPDLGLGQEQLVGAVSTLGLSDLCFGDNEVRELLPDASADLVARLSALTEGWPFAVHLAAIHAHNSPREADFLDASLATSSDELGAYISDVMLRQLPAEHRSILVDTSFMPIFDADLAEAITGVRACWQKLGDLKRANIISAVADADIQSYRCHPLLRTYLHRQLRSRGPGYMRQLRWRAVKCLRARGDYLAAARCAQNIGDAQLSIDIFLQAGGVLLTIVKGLARLQQALDLLPREAFSHPRVRAAEACALAKKGKSDIAFAMLESISTDAVPLDELPLVRRDINIAMLTTAAYSSKGLLITDWDRFTPLPIGGVQEIAAAEGFFYNIRCAVDFNVGDMDRAITNGGLSAHLYRTAGATDGLAHVHVHLARTLTELGRFDEARINLAEAERQFAAPAIPDYSGLALVDVFRARLDFMKGDFAAAEAKMEPALRTLQDGEHYWEALAAAYAILCELARLRGDYAGALNRLNQGLAYAQASQIVQLEAVLRCEAARLSVSADAIDHADSYGFADSKSLRLRAGAQWFESFMHSRLLAALLAQEGQGEAACDTLVQAARAAAAKRLACIQLDCLLDLVGIQESLGSRPAALGTLACAVDIGVVTGAVAPFVLRSSHLISLLALLQSQTKRSTGADPTPFISHLLTQCRNAHGRSATIFSAREQAVLRLLAASKGNKEIARELDISPETVRFHLKRIYEKLGISMGYHSRKIVRAIIRDAGLV